MTKEYDDLLEKIKERERENNRMKKVRELQEQKRKMREIKNLERKKKNNQVRFKKKQEVNLKKRREIEKINQEHKLNLEKIKMNVKYGIFVDKFKKNYVMTDTMKKIIDILKKNDLTRRDLVKEIELPRTTIYDNLKKLKDSSVVDNYSRNEGNTGRPLVYWKLINKNEVRNDE